MSDSFTEVTNQSWLSRIGSSIKGILFGLLFFIAAFPFLFWNEGRAIDTQRSLEEGASAVVSIKAETVSASNEGKLVHIVGKAETAEKLSDQEFNVSAQAISLSRDVLIYQWYEKEESKTEKNTGGSSTTKTTYSYSKKWLDHLVSSSSFQYPDKHQNPTNMPYDNQNWYANKVMVGAFELNPSLIKDIRSSQNIVLTKQNIPSNDKASLYNNEIYIGDPNTLEIGDMRISFSQVLAQTVSIVATQNQQTFVPFVSSNGRSIQLLEEGAVSAKEMFAHELSKNTLLTWGLRLLGFFIMASGLAMILKPLSVLADVIPFIGNILEAGSWFIASMVSLIFSLSTIAFAWMFYRPIVAGVVIVVIIAVIYLLKKKMKKNKPKSIDSSSAKTSVAPPPPPV